MNCIYITSAAATGFVGDALLQVATKQLRMGGPSGWGLLSYFALHGVVESLFIASGMMAIFYIIYFSILRLPVNLLYLAIYGIILDVIFRQTMICPSLQDYYNNLNYVWSAIWAAIPAILPVILYNVFTGKRDLLH
jgi:uncharacterized membrane protein YvlD (DUF360 family)